MVEIKNRNIEIEIIEKKPIEVGFLKRPSKAKSYRGHLIGCISKCKNDKNIELQKLYEEELRIFNKFYPLKIVKVILLEGWEKENGEFPVWKDVNNDFLVEIWHKGVRETQRVSKNAINGLLRAVRQLDKGKPYKCYDIAKLMGYTWKEIWADRMGLYFPIYYLPMKCLSAIGVVKYGGNHKTIIRLK